MWGMCLRNGFQQRYDKVVNRRQQGGAMRTIDIAHAAPLLEELGRSLEKGQEDEVVIVENGRPVAKLVPIGSSSRIGVAKGKFEAPGDPLALNAQVQSLFEEDGLTDAPLPAVSHSSQQKLIKTIEK